jgi:hypothetical protein
MQPRSSLDLSRFGVLILDDRSRRFGHEPMPIGAALASNAIEFVPLCGAQFDRSGNWSVRHIEFLGKVTGNTINIADLSEV